MAINEATEIQIFKKRKFIKIILSGEADIDFVNTLSKATQELSKKKGSRPLIIDMEKVSYIDSATLGVFVRLIKIFQPSGQKIIIYRPQGFIIELFEQTGLIGLLTVCESEEEVDRLL